MRRSARVLLPLLALLGLIAAGCAAPAPAPTGGPAAATGSTPAPAPAAAGTVVVNVLAEADTQPPTDQDFVKQGIDAALGTDLKLATINGSNEYYNQLNVRLAAGNPPDMFQTDRARLAQLAAQGQLLDLTPYLDQLGPTLAFIGEDGLKKGQIEGKTYGIAKAPFAPQYTYWVRQDWLDALGLQAPTTLEELRAVATAFATQDPDGNGRQDTYAITGFSFVLPPYVDNAFSPIFGAYGLGTPGSFYVKDGQLVNSLYEPAMRDALAFINELHEAGAIDPDLAGNTTTQWRDRVYQGQFGLPYINWPGMTSAATVETIATVNPNAEWAQIAPISGPGGSYDGSLNVGATSALWALPRTLEQQPEKLQKVFELMNYVSEGDGLLLVQFGVEGEHWTRDGETISLTDRAPEAGYTWIYQFAGRPEQQYLSAKFGYAQDKIDFSLAQPRLEILNGFVVPPEGYNANDANTFLQQQLLGFVNGSRPLSEYDAFLEELSGTYNYRAYVEAATQQLTELGFVQ